MTPSTTHSPKALPNRDIQQPSPSCEIVEPGVILSDGRQVLLPPKQRLALEWLMNEEGATLKDAAEYAGVTRATVSQWVNHDADFRAIYTAWRRQQEEVNDAYFVGLESAAMALCRQEIVECRNMKAAELVIKQGTARRRTRVVVEAEEKATDVSTSR